MTVITHKGGLGEGSITLESDRRMVDILIQDWTEPTGVVATHTMTVKAARKWLEEALKEVTGGSV